MKNKTLSLFIVALAYIIAFAAGGIVLWKIAPFMHPLLALFIADTAATIVIFIFNLILKNASIYDPYRSVQPIFVIFHILGSAGFIFMILLFTCISIPMMERHILEKHPEYADYKKKVRPLIFGPRRNKTITITSVFAIIILSFFIGCSGKTGGRIFEESPVSSNPIVYMTRNITPEGLIRIYEALGIEADGNVAVKISTGEPGNPHFLSPDLIKDLVQNTGGTIVESNTAYGGRRSSTALHYQVARDHGFTAIAPVVILDETADLSLPVTGGKHLTENFVGTRFNEFDFHIVLSHFKGHAMGGFGGALKNMSIGYASSAGKGWIHSGGKSKTSPWGGAQNDFLESMAEAAKSVADAAGNRLLYINVMNHLSVDCDCNGRPKPPSMADIGILGSLDPVALDQACVDLVYAAADGKELVERIESRNGILTITHAHLIGLGSKNYVLIDLDGGESD